MIIFFTREIFQMTLSLIFFHFLMFVSECHVHMDVAKMAIFSGVEESLVFNLYYLLQHLSVPCGGLKNRPVLAFYVVIYHLYKYRVLYSFRLYYHLQHFCQYRVAVLKNRPVLAFYVVIYHLYKYQVLHSFNLYCTLQDCSLHNESFLV